MPFKLILILGGVISMRIVFSFLLVFALFIPLKAFSAGGNNHAAIFLGPTKTDSSTEPTAGIEFEYRLPMMNKLIGVGVVAERIFSDHAANLFLAGAVVHPWKALKFNLFYGQERADGHSDSLFRVGAGYDFHYKRLSYGPVFNIDSVGGHTTQVAGITLGMGF